MVQPEYILALDVGEKRVGVAIAHQVARIASPLKTLERTENIMQDIADLVEHEEVYAVVVGLPRGMSGQYTAQTRATEDFTVTLKSMLKVPVYLADETLTSVKAETELKGKTHQKGDVDALAAAYILEDFLHDHPEVAHA